MSLLLLALVALAAADTIKWTGEGVNNLWDNIANWDLSRLPDINDDVVVPAGFNILVGTAAGAHGKSFDIGATTLTIAGASVEVGTGGVVFRSGAAVSIDGGAGTFSVAGKAQVSDDVTIVFKSGSVTGEWIIYPKATFRFASNGGLLNWPSGSIANNGLIHIDSSVVNASAKILNNALVKIEGADTFLMSFLIVLTETPGRVTIAGTTRVGTFTAQGVHVDGTLRVWPGGNVIIQGLKVTDTGIAFFGDPSVSDISGVVCTGQWKVSGALAKLTVSGGADIRSVEINYGSVTFLDSYTVDTIISSFGTLGTKTTGTARILTTEGGGLFALEQNGTLKVDTANIQGILQVRSNLVVSTLLNVQSKQVTLDGTITTGGLTRLSKEVGFWGPSNAQRPGKLTLGGPVEILAPNATWNGFVVAGTPVAFTVNEATFDFQSQTLNALSFTLNDTTAVVRAEGVSIGYGTLIGPKAGSNLAVIKNNNYAACTSPCPGFGVTPLQVFRAWVRP